LVSLGVAVFPLQLGQLKHGFEVVRIDEEGLLIGSGCQADLTLLQLEVSQSSIVACAGRICHRVLGRSQALSGIGGEAAGQIPSIPVGGGDAMKGIERREGFLSFTAFKV